MPGVFRNWLCKARASQTAQRMRAHARSGSAALEFAMVAPIFFLMTFAIIETGVLYFSQATLQYAATDAARLVRTGQVQSGAMTQAAFRTQVCNRIAPLLACDTNLTIDMKAYPTGFGGANYTTPLDANGNLNPNQSNFQPGNAGDVVLVRVLFTWPVMTPVLTPFLTNMSGNKHLLIATAAFRNEPF